MLKMSDHVQNKIVKCPCKALRAQKIAKTSQIMKIKL